MDLFRPQSSGLVKGICRILIITGLVFFITAIFYPFLTAQYFGMKIPEAIKGPTKYWSFMQEVSYGWGMDWNLRSKFQTQTQILGEYWDPWLSHPEIFHRLLTGVVITTLFEAQIVTVIVSILAIVKTTMGLIVASTFLAAFNVLLMALFANLISDWNIVTYEIGFWFTLLSMIPLSFAIAIHFRRST